MGEVVKWGLLATAIVSLVGACAGIFAVVDIALVATGLSDAVYTLVEHLATHLQTARGFLNNFAVPEILDICLWVAIVYPFVKYAVRVIGWIYHWIFK